MRCSAPNTPMEGGSVAPADAESHGSKVNSSVKPQRSRELKPHRPEYSDVGFLSDAEMKERRSKRYGTPTEHPPVGA